MRFLTENLKVTESDKKTAKQPSLLTVYSDRQPSLRTAKPSEKIAE